MSEPPHAGSSRAELEAFYTREYEPSRLIPDHERIRESFWQRSEATREETDCELDIPYGAHERQKLDVFPAAGHASSLVVFIHGGYWRSFDRRAYSFLAPAFTAAGAACVIPSYGLAPATPMETLVGHVGAAVRWAHEHAGQFGADGNRLFLVGHSAGAHLLALLMAEGMPASGLIRGGLAISGVYDLRPLLNVPVLNADLQLTEERAAALSPALMQPGSRAPLWTSVGGVEPAEFHRQTKLIEDRWRSIWAGHIPMPQSNHLSIVNDLATAGTPLNGCIATLLAARGKPEKLE